MIFQGLLGKARKILILIPALFLATACTDNGEPKVPVPTLNLNLSAAETLSFSELATEVKYIPLDSRLGFLGDSYELVKLTRNYILIIENNNPERIINLFDRNGKGITRIHQVGEGPGKYYKVSDAWIDENKQRIELLDGIQSKIVVYDFDGNFVTDKKLPGNFDHFIKLVL